MDANKEKAIDLAVSQIERQFGKGAIMKLGEGSQLHNVPTIPTGSIGLDMALGVGGVPRGRVVEIYGPESSGKTTLALHILAEAQRLGGMVAFVDAEHALDLSYAQKLGVQTDELLISQPDHGEQALEIAETLVRSGAIDVLVIDSVAALVPRAEIEGEMGDSHMGLQARLMSQALRKLTGTISRSQSVVIFINQIRMKIGVMFGNPETTTGGNALKFYSSLRMEIRRTGALKDADSIIGGPHPGEGGQEQDGAPLSGGRVRHPLRHRHIARGGAGGHRHRHGRSGQERRLVLVRGRPHRPGPRERQAVPARAYRHRRPVG